MQLERYFLSHKCYNHADILSFSLLLKNIDVRSHKPLFMKLNKTFPIKIYKGECRGN